MIPTEGRYAITRVVLGREPEVVVAAEYLNEAIQAKRRLMAGLALEEKINLLIENYEEFELELLRLPLQQLLYSDDDWSSFVGDVQTLNRRLLNLLASIRMYCDHVGHALNLFYGGTGPHSEWIKKRLLEERNTNRGLRVLEAVRNYVQHRDLPLHAITYQHQWDESRSPQVLMRSVEPALRPEKLVEDPKFNKEVAAELKAIGDRANAKPLVREAVGGISLLHGEVRTRLADELREADGLFMEAAERFIAAGGTSVVGLAVAHFGGDGSLIKEIPLVQDLAKRRQWLERRNRPLLKLPAWAVTSEVSPAWRPNDRR